MTQTHSLSTSSTQERNNGFNLLFYFFLSELLDLLARRGILLASGFLSGLLAVAIK